MRLEQIPERLRAWRRRTLAWGALLDDQRVLLVSLAVQSTGSVRVATLEHPHATPVGPQPAQAREGRLVERLRAAGAQLPRRERMLALALHHSRCGEGVYQPPPQLDPGQLAAEVQLEAAQALGVQPHEVGFDFDVQPDRDDVANPPVLWMACRREDLQQCAEQARHAGWQLPLVEPEHQAARRAASCLRGDARLQWAQSPQDWQFECRPVRSLDEAQWRAWQAAPQWGALVACGAALGLLA